MPLPAAQLLQPDSPARPAWAVFDPIWYLQCHGAALPAGIAYARPALLRYYLEHGCVAGHSPSPLFDEIHYLLANPAISALVQAGRYASGFDHFCQIGHRFHAGHWLFDDALYAGLHDDMSLENLDGNGMFGRYDHYLRSGQHEHRQAHKLFDSRFYAAQAIAAGDDPHVIAQLGPYTHCLYRLHSEAAELPPSVYFDPAWYAENHEQARAEIAGQRPGSALQHYLRAGGTERLDPVPQFSETFYLETNPDAAAALQAGDCSSGYQHFLQTGVFELRCPSPGIDLTFYRDANARVRNDLNTGAVRDVFAHLRGIGLAASLPFAPPPARLPFTEDAAKDLFIGKARDSLAVFARRKLDFSASNKVSLSVIMVLFEKFELTMQSLAALRSNYAGAMQLILVDNGSSDATADIAQFVEGASIIRLEKNIGYLRACNLALREVTAELVLFLNNDIELGFGAIEAGISRIGSDARIGAVGGKVIRSHGLLQEAGCIIWRDGSTEGYMRDASPLAPEANFLRDVDFCSGVFLLCRTAIVKRLGGFDGDFSPAYYEDADLCLRMAQSGQRVVYDPAIIVHHLEYGSAGAAASRALMQRGKRLFAAKHQAFLQTRPPVDARSLAVARAPRRTGRNILFIEDTIPRRRLGSGYVRANDIIHALAALGHFVSVFPVNGAMLDSAGIYTDFPETVEVLHDRDLRHMAAFLESRPGHYDLVWISRTHNLARILPACLQAGIDPARIPFILDTEAVAALRDAARQALDGGDFDFGPKLREELELARLCRHCIAVTETEARLLRRAGPSAVSVLGTMRRPEPTEAAFAERQGILFVASIHQPDSPNLDSLSWYAKEILPALCAQMPAPPVLNFAGHVAPGIDLSPFADHALIKIHGAAAALRAHYARNRLFIAPTRFAAGAPYKLYEAASFGLPMVATGMLARQLGWRDGEELLTASRRDAKGFAAQIARLYDSPALWGRLRQNALARITAENGPEAFSAAIAEILAHALPEGDARSGAVRQRTAGHPVAV